MLRAPIVVIAVALLGAATPNPMPLTVAPASIEQVVKDPRFAHDLDRVRAFGLDLGALSRPARPLDVHRNTVTMGTTFSANYAFSAPRDRNQYACFGNGGDDDIFTSVHAINGFTVAGISAAPTGDGANASIVNRDGGDALHVRMPHGTDRCDVIPPPWSSYIS